MYFSWIYALQNSTRGEQLTKHAYEKCHNDFLMISPENFLPVLCPRMIALKTREHCLESDLKNYKLTAIINCTPTKIRLSNKREK